MNSITARKNHPAEIRRTLELGAPVMIGLVASFGMNFVDTVMAGRLDEKDVALAALATGGAIWSAMLMLTVGTLMALQPVVAQLHGAGRNNSPHAQTGRDGFPPGNLTTQHNDHGVATFDARCAQCIGQLARRQTDITKGFFDFLSAIVNPQHRQFFWVISPTVNNLCGKIKVLWTRPLKRCV